MHKNSHHRRLLLTLVATFGLNLAALGVASAAVTTPPSSDTDIVNSQGTSSTDTDTFKAGNSDVTIDKPDVHNPEADTPDVDSTDISKPDLETPDVSTPDVSRPDIERPDVQTPEVDH